MKFVQLILRKIIKTVATRCQILGLKCSKFDLGWGSAPDPKGGDERGWEGGEGRGGKRGEDERGGDGGEGRGEEAFLVMWPRRLSALNPPLMIVLMLSAFQSIMPAQLNVKVKLCHPVKKRCSA